jgi:hypothetical protein
MDRGFCQDALPWYVNMLREAQLGEFRKDTLRFTLAHCRHLIENQPLQP